MPTFLVPLNILGFFVFPAIFLLWIPLLHYTVISIKRNFIDLILLGREYYLNISREETLCLLTNETVFRLLGSNCI